MKAVIWTRYGGPEGLVFGVVDTPEPANNEIRVRVVAATVTAGDCEVRSLKVPGLIRLPMRIYIGIRKPQRIKILGQEVSGVVDAVGKDVTGFAVGDEVLGWTGVRMGAYAEYVCLPAAGGGSILARKPADLSFDESAAISTGGLEAQHFLQLAGIRPGESVVINGAGGSIGTFGVQLAKHFGAEVTAVDRPEKHEMLRSLGADHVVDYTREDFTRLGRTYDVIFDIVGKSRYFSCLRAMNPGGRYLIANPGLLHRTGRIFPAGAGRKVVSKGGGYTAEALAGVRDLVAAGTIKIVIDRRFPLAETAEAHRYVETGRKMGNVIISVA